MLELAGLEMKENCGIEELTLGEKKLLLLIKLVADTSKQYIFQSLFQDMEENEVQSAVRLIVEMSTYMNVILLSSSSEGYEICDRVIQWSGNDGRGHIARSKIKDMCIMPPFVMRDILKVIRASETAEVVIPCFEKVSLMADEATINVTCSEYFFRCCKELETIFYHYTENHVEEL